MSVYRKFERNDILSTTVHTTPHVSLASGSAGASGSIVGWRGNVGTSSSLSLYEGVRARRNVRAEDFASSGIAIYPIDPVDTHSIDKVIFVSGSYPSTGSVQWVKVRKAAPPALAGNLVYNHENWYEEHFSPIELLFDYYSQFEEGYFTGSYDYYSLFFDQVLDNRASHLLFSASYLPEITGTFTVEAWVKPLHVTSSLQNFTVQSQRNRFRFFISGSGKLAFDDRLNTVLTSSVALQRGTWQHVSFVADGTSGTFRIDDVEKGKYVFTGSLQYGRMSESLPFMSATVDTTNFSGLYPSLKLQNVGAGSPAIVYREHTNGRVRFARSGSWGWASEQVAGDLDSGWFNTLFIDSTNTPHVAFRKDSVDPTGLHYAVSSSTGWHIQFVHTGSQQIGSNAIIHSGVNGLEIAYADVRNPPAIMCAKSSSTEGWVKRTVLAGAAGDYFHSWFAFDVTGNLHSVYKKADTSFHYTLSTSLGLTTQQIGPAAPRGDRCVIALDYLDRPHVTHYDGADFDLYYSASGSMGDGWVTEAVETVDNVGEAWSAPVPDATGKQQVFYQDATQKTLKFARRLGTNSWNTRALTYKGPTTNVVTAVRSGSKYHIGYLDGDGQDMEYGELDINLTELGKESLTVGAEEVVSGSSIVAHHGFKGYMFESRIWKKGLTATEMSSSWDRTLLKTSGSADLLHYARMNDGPLSTVHSFASGSGSWESGRAAVHGQFKNFYIDLPVSPLWQPNDNPNFVTEKRRIDIPIKMVRTLHVPSMFYGRQIATGSVQLVCNSYSNKGITRVVVDDGRGNLYVSGSMTRTISAENYAGAKWNKVGNVFYTEGLVVITDPSLLDFGEVDKDWKSSTDHLSVQFDGMNRIPTKILVCRLGPAKANASRNPTFTVLDGQGDDDPANDRLVLREDATTRITAVGIYNEERKLVAVAKFASPIRKREKDKLALRLRLDF